MERPQLLHHPLCRAAAEAASNLANAEAARRRGDHEQAQRWIAEVPRAQRWVDWPANRQRWDSATIDQRKLLLYHAARNAAIAGRHGWEP